MEIKHIIIPLLLLLASAVIAAPPEKPSKAWLMYERAERYGTMGNLVYKANVDAHWIGDTHKFWYRNDVRGKSEFILIDADTGTREVVKDIKQFKAAPKPDEKSKKPEQAQPQPADMKLVKKSITFS